MSAGATRPRYSIDQCALYKLRGHKQLSDRLFHPVETLQAYVDRRTELYREWDIQKPSGGLRHIESPHRALKLVQTRMAQLLMRLEPPEFLFCPVKGRDFVMNALRHANARSIWCMDVKEYFASTTVESVLRFYQKRLRCEADIAWILTKLSTHNGHLPTGSPLSPILAYYANEPMWTRVVDIVESNGCTPSLYIDDLTISGGKVSYDDVRAPVTKVLNEFGFYGHKQVHRTDQAAAVTGVLVGIGRSVLPPSHFKRFRQKLLEIRNTTNEDDRAKAERSAEGMLQLRYHVERRRVQAVKM